MFETERLFLKKYDMTMVEDVYRVINHKEIADTMITIPYPFPKQAAERWVDYLMNSFANKTSYEFAVYIKPNIYIGNVGLMNISPKHMTAELGYFIDPNYWGKGYATEACAKIIELAFEQLALNRIYAKTLTSNTSSIKVLDKNGFSFEGMFKNEFRKEDVYYDINHYALLKLEYEQMKMKEEGA